MDVLVLVLRVLDLNGEGYIIGRLVVVVFVFVFVPCVVPE
jgi:hypothetical protein